jgi:demethylmenaquinone methyltransferase/2-methoxy-6-polyprenyl-1,4-benzoquinol methylase/ArsR family transcriptional regulator
MLRLENPALDTARGDPFLHTAGLPEVLTILEAAGEITRLRLLALLAEAELTVSELVTILGQSQPRISRHLRLLVEAGLIERHREGAWAFFFLASQGQAAALARNIITHIRCDDEILAADRSRLAAVRQARADQAARYFAEHAPDWNRIRSLHIAENIVEDAIREVIGNAPIHAALDLGTGTGRMLDIIAPLALRAIGIDQSPAMLNIARTHIERKSLRNVQLRQGDLYALPVERDGYDLVIIHQVLHYLDDPARAIREAARVLRPQGRLLIIDFAPHALEFLREHHAHRRLGFARGEIDSILHDAKLDITHHRDLAPAVKTPDQLTVSLWLARDQRRISDRLPTQDVA